MGTAVLVYAYTFVPGSPGAWADRISNSPDRLAAIGGQAAAEIGRDTDAATPSDLRLGPIATGRDIVLIPLTWDLPGLCGTLDGELALGRLDATTTQITFRASCTDGPHGRHPLAEFAAKLLVERLPAALGHALPAGSGERAAIVSMAAGDPAGRAPAPE